MTRTDATPAPEREVTDAAPGHGAALSHGLKQRHLSMIALGGVIGAGLFVGSGTGIAAAGPGIVLAYAVSGLLVMLVMRMLGEMAAANPASGTFSVHAEKAIGPWAGFTAGWMFWIELCVGIAVEAIGAAAIMVKWFPSTDSWMWVLLFMAVFCGTNLAAVGNFGEFEFWFATLKVAAIGVFLVLGVLAICGMLPGTDAPGTDNLTGHGGFLPNGTDGLVAGLLASVFAYGGLETVTIAAAESEQPVKGVAKAVRTAMWRIALFYVGSMLVVVTLIPWTDKSVLQGPYVAVLKYLDVPAAGEIMNVIVLIALLSAMNANIYGASRMAHSLVERGEGPRFLGKVSSGVPRRTVVASSAFGFFAVLLSYWWPDTVFKWLLYMTGAAVLVVWGFIAVTQLMMRHRMEQEQPGRLVVRMWWFPYLTVAALLGILCTLGLMLREKDTAQQLYATAGLTVALALVGYLRQRATARGRN
ncbi:amino acid permease [Streptomyces mobaraensis NBRC 13819 = DSM 40847]|uniref:Amino acid permease n=2 Tax=Streptomyces mobaraensis TaxID=35621 RepID=A0A5N5WCQ1_STRMB|nr:amino acid permease [Streptomyces mobaraensis]KAB7850053.1 amino acid permease [Streptomyces mobaraensis]QTT73830.1 amino acid permease [Streptomyces mobaraensis NBRC 13819 = DSM 40847]